MNIKSAKRISKSGTVQLAFSDLKGESKYRQLVNKIKSKGANKKGEKIYANFALTQRRNTLLYTIRAAWREKQIDKFFVDYDGTITIVLPNSSKKIKVTSVANRDTNYVLWTISNEELKLQIDRGFHGF